MKRSELTRTRIISSCNDLFYRQGYHHTSFSDIVEVAGISKGNITYHFNCKRAILNAVFELRAKQIKSVLRRWDEQQSDPTIKLNQFIGSLISAKKTLVQYGCPNGSLAYELGKSASDAAELSKPIFELICQWLATQFMSLGFSSQQSRNRATELYTRAQGIIVLAQAYRDEIFFEHQINQLINLIEVRSAD